MTWFDDFAVNYVRACNKTKEAEAIVAIRYLKETGEFVITTRNETTGKQAKTYANNLTDNERAWAKESKYCFEDPMSICWTN